MLFLNFLLVRSLLLFCPSDTFGRMYKWVDETGQIHWSDTPPPPDAKALVLKEYETFEEKTKSRGLYTSKKKAATKSQSQRAAIENLKNPSLTILRDRKTFLLQYMMIFSTVWLSSRPHVALVQASSFQAPV